MGKGIVAMVLGILTAGCNPTLATYVIVQPDAGTPMAYPAGCGGDAYQLVREHAEGSYGSNCYQVRARILACGGCSS